MPSSTLTNLSHLYTGQVLCVHQCVLQPVPHLPLLADTASRGLPGARWPVGSWSTLPGSCWWTGGPSTTWRSWSTLHKPDLSGGVIEEGALADYYISVADYYISVADHFRGSNCSLIEARTCVTWWNISEFTLHLFDCTRGRVLAKPQELLHTLVNISY